MGKNLTKFVIGWSYLQKRWDKNHILKREQLLEYLWDSSENFVGDTSLNTAMSRLRKKIEIDNHHYIKTIYGTGYMWIGNWYG